MYIVSESYTKDEFGKGKAVMSHMSSEKDSMKDYLPVLTADQINVLNTIFMSSDVGVSFDKLSNSIRIGSFSGADNIVGCTLQSFVRVLSPMNIGVSNFNNKDKNGIRVVMNENDKYIFAYEASILDLRVCRNSAKFALLRIIENRVKNPEVLVGRNLVNSITSSKKTTLDSAVEHGAAAKLEQ